MFAKTLLCVIGLEQAEADIERAAALGLECQAHLSVLVIGISAPPMVGDLPVDGTGADGREAQAETIGAQEKMATLVCERAGLSFDVSSIQVELAWADDEIAERARYADLVLVGQSALRDETLKRQTVNGTLFAAERPVMVMSDQAPATLQPKKVVLAWDSGQQAGRAAYDMRQLIATAEEAHVVMVDPTSHWRRNGEEPGADIARYLTRHGAAMVVDRLSSGGRPVPEVIVQHAVDIGADLIVMGAYHHSRLRERLLGGVTRTMLNDCPLPILMSR